MEIQVSSSLPELGCGEQESESYEATGMKGGFFPCFPVFIRRDKHISTLYSTAIY